MRNPIVQYRVVVCGDLPHLALRYSGIPHEYGRAYCTSMAGHTARVWPDIPHEYGRTYCTSMAGHLVLRYVPTLDSMLRLSHNTLIFDGSLIGIEFAEICVIVPELISVRKIPLRLKKEKYPLFFKHITNNPYFCAGKNSYEHKKAEKNTGQIIKTFFLSCNFFARIYQ